MMRSQSAPGIYPHSSFPTRPTWHSARGFRTKLAACALPVFAALALAKGSEIPTPGDGRRAYVKRTWTTVDGLPQNTVNVTLQTKDGFLWIGTNAGLARFDGARFRTFGLQD